MANEIQKIEANGRGLVLKSIDDFTRWAEGVVKSNFAPAHYKTSAQVVVATQAGMELGFTPFQALQVLHVVNGKVGIASSAMGGLVRSRSHLEYMEQYYEGEPFDDDFKAIVKSKRKDETVSHESEYSVADAKMAKLWGKAGSWSSDPKDMLMWRALSKHCRRYYGDILCGLYTTEELLDMRPEQDYQPETPKRDDRKQVENEAENSNALIQDCVKGVFEIFMDKYPDLRIADNNEVIESWAKFCADTLGGEVDDYWQFDDDVNKTLNLDHFNQENIIQLKDAADALPEQEHTAEKKFKCARCGNTYKKMPKDGKCKCLGEVKEDGE